MNKVDIQYVDMEQNDVKQNDRAILHSVDWH